MKRIFVLLLFSILVLRCKENVLIPPEEKLKDPREMTWKIDTLQYQGSAQTLMSSMFANSSNNIYLAGHNDGLGQIWHYDGQNWVWVDLIPKIGGYSINGLKGITEKSFWVYGTRGSSVIGNSKQKCFVLQNNGDNWTPHELDGNGRILSVGGDNENNVWACGDSGVVFNYNGVKWNKDRIKILLGSNWEYLLKDISVYKGEVFLLANVYVPLISSKYYFIKGKLSNWAVIDSMIFDGYNQTLKWGINGLYVSKSGKLYSYGNGGIWEWLGNSWIRKLSVNYPIQGMFVLSDNYIIAVGDYGNVHFYNGNSWDKVINIPLTQSLVVCCKVWTNGNEIIIVGYTAGNLPQVTLVWRGK